MTWKKTIDNLFAMQQFAIRVAQYADKGFTVCLSGELGAGKTTFTQFFGAAIGIDEPINSPTFTIMKLYDDSNLPLVHIDAYRLEGVHEEPSLEDYIFGPYVCVIEWYEHIKGSLPDNYLAIDFMRISETSRELIIKGSGRYETIAKALSH